MELPPKKVQRLLIDLNHPADFHLFRKLIRQLQSEGFSIRILARNKECLHTLLKDEGLEFFSRGKGSNRRAGKYIYAVYNLLFILLHVLLFRPRAALRLSSPYLNLVAYLTGIRSICYDDTDLNPKLLPFIAMAGVVISPSSYPHHFHKNHLRLPVFKELAYLPGDLKVPEQRQGIFIRFTRIDSIHHSDKKMPDYAAILNALREAAPRQSIILSSELGIGDAEGMDIIPAGVTSVHEDLNTCSIFWGNSATMAAEAVALGIPAVYFGRDVFSYLREMEAGGMLYCFAPDELEASIAQLSRLLNDPGCQENHMLRRRELMANKQDVAVVIHSMLRG